MKQSEKNSKINADLWNSQADSMKNFSRYFYEIIFLVNLKDISKFIP